jgi:hypothetical protein
VARNVNPLALLMKKFSADIESAVSARVNQEFAARFDDLRDSVISAVARGAGAQGRRGRPAGGTFALRRKPGPRAGTIVAELKPCPVCSEKNKARRFSYLCEKHRSTENLAKFKSARSAAKAGVAPKAGRAPKAAGKAVAAAKTAKAGGKAKVSKPARKSAPKAAAATPATPV